VARYPEIRCKWTRRGRIASHFAQTARSPSKADGSFRRKHDVARVVILAMFRSKTKGRG
jgi:hypothetical protein